MSARLQNWLAVAAAVCKICRWMLRTRIPTVVLALLGAAGVAGADVLSVENRFLERRFESNGGRLGGAMLLNKLTGHTVRYESPDFRIKFLDGTELTGENFDLERTTLRNKDTTAYTFVLTNELHAIEARVEAVVHPQEPWVRKRLWLRHTGAAILALDEVDVEHAKFNARVTIPAGSPRGQPLVFDDQWFAGLEFPGAENIYTNGTMSLRQRPGVQLGPEWWGSEWSVMGVAPAGKVRDAFAAYLNQVALPPRTMTLYNSWYDLRGPELTTTNLQATFEKFRVKLDTFVPDDGWQRRDSIWQTDPKFLPEGWGPLARWLKSKGTRLGLWMPLCGYGLDTPYGLANGLEVATGGKYYCLSGPNYQSHLCGRIMQMFRDYGLNYFKHDFNFFECSEPGHGHFPGGRHGFEANVRAEVRLLDWMRQANSNVFLNVTSCMWLSPWWLQHADAIWRGGSDHGAVKQPLAWERRDWEISYRDSVLYRDATRDGPLFPISRMMTHGITDARRARLGGTDEPLDKWADNVLNYLGQGVRMRELYLTPSLLNDRQWRILSQALAWADHNAATLDHGEWIGGNPASGELYGLEHRGDGATIWVLRNPAAQSQSIELAFPKGRHIAQVYPCRSDVTNRTVTVRGHGTVILQTFDAPLRRKEPVHANPDFKFHDDATLLKLTLDTGPDVTRARFIAVVQNAGRELAMKATVNGQTAASKKVRGDGWDAFVVPLVGGRNEIALAFDAGLNLFAPGEPKLSEWVEVMRELPAGEAPFGIEFVRQVVPIAAPGPLPLPEAPRAKATEAGLSQATEAKLHLRIFGSNGNAPYGEKPLTLNGVFLGQLPANKGELDAWQEVVLDLPRDARQSLTLDNELTIINRGGDNFKVGGFALAALIPGQGWVETPMRAAVHSSHAGWLHSEGQPFKANTLTVRLRFAK